MSTFPTPESEVTRLLNQIKAEYEAAQNGLYGLASGTSQHAFITARMEHMSLLHTELQSLIGDAATALVVEQLNASPEQHSVEHP
ncbi:hypothetical protein KDA_49410 [Dictyobacter alpinus]|uniref:Uncharacterized protein n=1 Tax=Dictyobacter alpinus TaxID=2014873 RepID=A0A402BDX4_9CHLR|nr:hypothetical protein [Dictyobacter alpinus]GCE29457.1 hypothetical protein KDA_49410 [Dictyobacter alpinus]